MHTRHPKSYFLPVVAGFFLISGCAANIPSAKNSPPPSTKAPVGSGKAGTVVSVDITAGTLVVKPRIGDNITIATDTNTKVVIDRKDATLGDVKADMTVLVRPVTGTAQRIDATSTVSMSGGVVSVDATTGTLVVKPLGTGDNLTVATDKNTKVEVAGKDATLADVKVDMRVLITPATGTAQRIVANKMPLIQLTKPPAVPVELKRLCRPRRFMLDDPP